MRKRASGRIKRARAYILVTFDGEGEPIYSFDINSCKDQNDIRHWMMHTVANYVEGTYGVMIGRVEKLMREAEQSAKAEEVRMKRSEELSRVA
jgi:hypothetical protein